MYAAHQMCVYVCACTCMYVRVYIHACAYIQKFANTYVYIHTCAHSQNRTCTHTYIHSCACTHACNNSRSPKAGVPSPSRSVLPASQGVPPHLRCTCTRAFVFVCVCVNACICVCKCTRARARLCLCVSMCVCVCVCVCVSNAIRYSVTTVVLLFA
jgi:hypothetical protein